ncbi:MAG: transcriptional regulator [Bacteroidetes bacterium]|nr:MAG: transcriptional regulator [Bacteroidota bacterium]
MFSKACEYGMRATIYVAQQSELGKKVGVKTIAAAIESPEAFTGKIMQQLTKSGFIKSMKGPSGGFFMDKASIEETRLGDLVTLFDGKDAYQGCVLGLPVCSDTHSCPLHKESAPIVQKVRKLLETKTLYDILYTEDKMNTFWLKTG